MLKYLKIYPKYLAMAIKSKLAYRMDAIIGSFGFIASNTAAFFTLYLTITAIPALGDWTIEKMVFLYGFCLVPKAIDHILSDNLWSLGNWMVTKGELDPILTRPLNPLFQIVAREFQYEGFGELILGIIFLAVYGPQQNIVWKFNNVMPLVICGFLAIFLFFAIKLITASLAFWMKRSISVMSGIYELSNFTKYPLEIFHDIVKVILVAIIPFSLVMYYPVSYLYEGKSIWVLTGIIALVVSFLVMLGYLLFKLGLKRYESAGS